jgi:hypothetical protein
MTQLCAFSSPKTTSMSRYAILRQPARVLPVQPSSEHNAAVRIAVKAACIAAILLFSHRALFTQSSKAPRPSPNCKLYAKPSAYDGIMVRIRAVYGGSFEGSYLFDVHCHKDLWFTTPSVNNTLI